MFDYVAGNSPRSKLGQGVYTSTEYPPPYFISLHNEMSYSSQWPQRLFFCCLIEPTEGGATPLIDSRGLLRSLPGELVDEFKRKQVRYIRNLHGGSGMGKSWQETFETREKSVVDGYASASGAGTKWNPDGSLTLTNVGPATITHPDTQEEVWFNQADQFHPSTLAPEMYKALLGMYRSEEFLPQNATYGDRSSIPLSYLDSIREVTRARMQPMQWRRGDLLIVDNVLTAHGRMPFKGQRRILVSMTAGPKTDHVTS